MSLSKNSIKLLRQVKRAILAEPELYDQSCSPIGYPSCNTPSCIAGWAAWVKNPNQKAYANAVNSAANGTSLLAESAGITMAQARLLFCQWPDKFDKGWGAPTKRTANVSAARIEHFIATGGAE